MERGSRAQLTPAQQARADVLFDEVLDLAAGDRARHLAERASAEPKVVDEVASLLASAEACGDFLSRPAAPHPAPDSGAPGSDGLPAERIGAWRLVRAIGHGGMGEVFEAERVEGGFAQRAALKLLRREASDQLARFHVERQILARLEHPGIARLLDGGVAPDGRPYMAMEFVDGRSLSAWCEDTHATLDERLRLFVQVCDAVAYAHHHLVVHRDLKPSNILVDADGQARLLDFGIAKLLDDREDPDQTVTRGAPLTPSHAAPEQLRGGSITTATDVYALGLLLFELLTGTPAWPAGGAPMAPMLRALADTPAPVPSARARATAQPPVAASRLRGDLDAIVAKALRADPSHRYATVDALRRDIGLTRRGDAITARDGARLYALGRSLRRHRLAAASATAVFAALLLGFGVAAVQAHRAAAERDVALRNAAREEALRYQLTGLFRSAIADHGSATPTAKQMLDKSAERVLHEYRDRPQLAGEVVLSLADLYDALEDVQGSAALLDGFLAQAGPDADPFAVADARQKLAGIELMRGHIERSGRLLDEAERHWAVDPRAHAEERLEGRAVRARWQRATGDLEGAIATDRATIALRVALSGRDHRETATLYNSLAITLAAANRLDEALAAYHETSAIYDRLGLGDGLDAQIIRGNTGTLALRAGQLKVAEGLLRGAVEHERALAGDSAAVAASLGYYGKLLIVTGRPSEAIDQLGSAVDLARRYTGATSPLTVQNRLFLGEAQGAVGNFDESRRTLDADHADALAHYGRGHALTLRTELALAQLDDAEGGHVAASAALLPVVERLRALGNPARTTLAQALLALGGAELGAGDAGAALPALREAVALREGGAAWELAQAQERLGEALTRAGSAAAARPLLTTAWRTLQTELGPAHLESRRTATALARLAG